MDPKELPRVPKATENGLQEGRPHPALRRYQANYRAVDWTEGLKLMAARRSGEEPAIKGGVDDNSPEMELENTVLPDPYAKMQIDPKKPVSKPKPKAAKPKPAPATRPEAASSDDPTGKNSGPNATNPYLSRDQVMKMAPGSVEAFAGRFDPFSSSNSVDEEIPPDAVMPGRPVKAPPAPEERRQAEVPAPDIQELVDLRVRADRLFAENQALNARIRKHDEYLSQRTRVQVQLDAMSFGVSAVDVIESPYGIVVLLPLDGNSMTFKPAPMSPAVIACPERGLSFDVAFSGTSFDVPALGVSGLVFVKRPPKKRSPLSEFVNDLSQVGKTSA